MSGMVLEPKYRNCCRRSFCTCRERSKKLIKDLEGLENHRIMTIASNFLLESEYTVPVLITCGLVIGGFKLVKFINKYTVDVQVDIQARQLDREANRVSETGKGTAKSYIQNAVKKLQSFIKVKVSLPEEKPTNENYLLRNAHMSLRPWQINSNTNAEDIGAWPVSKETAEMTRETRLRMAMGRNGGMTSDRDFRGKLVAVC